MITKVKYFICAISVICGLASCEDFFETDSNRQIFDPQLDEKTDSMFYMLGIMKGVQQVADQYVLTNEMRGDLVATNSYTETSLKNLAQFRLDEMKTNKYDSAYLYYRIINNCNYFIAHRKDSALMTGSRYVNIPEIAEAHAVRAWTYLQLVKTYGRVPFYTDPLVTIGAASEIRDSVDLTNILSKFEADLIHYSGIPVPSYGEVSAGHMYDYSENKTKEKKVHSSNIMLPVDVVLGDLYLESHEYEKAAKSYFNYIKLVGLSLSNYYVNLYKIDQIKEKVPTTMIFSPSGNDWSSIFAFSSPKDSITYIPLASNRLRGVTTNLPRYFGYDLYSTSASERFIVERQIEASNAYRTLSAAQDFYYSQRLQTGKDTVLTAPLGDLRRYATFKSATRDNSTFDVMIKFSFANIPIYRGATVYLRLAEAINRMGYPDVAFAILKDGLNRELATSGLYLSAESYEFLRTTIPFFSDENISNFTLNTGIHSFGSGYTRGAFSPYQLDSEMDRKVAELNAKYGEDFIKPIYTTVEVFDEEGNPVLDEEGNPVTEVVKSWQKQDLINVVEDLICDEYALELAFEGNRFGDLCRIARHKNDAGTYGSDYGSRWLADKLAYKHPAVDLTNPQNWYMPFSK